MLTKRFLFPEGKKQRADTGDSFRAIEIDLWDIFTRY